MAGTYAYAGGKITVTGGTPDDPADMAAMHDADVLGTWNVVTETEESANYTVDADIQIGDGTTETFFQTKREFVYMEDDKDLTVKAAATMQMGTALDVQGFDGSYWSIAPSTTPLGIVNAIGARFNWYGSTIYLRNNRRIFFDKGVVKIRSSKFTGRRYDDGDNLSQQRLYFYTTITAYINDFECANLLTVEFRTDPIFCKDLKINRVASGVRGYGADITAAGISSTARRGSYAISCNNDTNTDHEFSVVDPKYKVAKVLTIQHGAESTGDSRTNEIYTFNTKVVDSAGNPRGNVPVICKDAAGVEVFSTETSPYELTVNDTAKLAYGVDREPYFSARIPTNQTNSYYAAGLYWVWFVRHADATTTYLSYRTSADGKIWSDVIDIPTSYTSTLSDAGWSLWFDGTNVHYITGVWYRRGVPNSDSTITWASAESNQSVFSDSGMCVDTSGYPWIGVAGDGPTHGAYRGQYSNGTWGTGIEYDFSQIGGKNTAQKVVPLVGGDVYFVRHSWGINSQLLGNLFDESIDTMLGNETVTLRECYCQVYNAEIATIGVASNGSQGIFIAYMDTLGDIYFRNRIAAPGGSWDVDEVLLATSAYTDFETTNPTISIDPDTNYIYVIWASNDRIYMKKREAAGAWSAIFTLVEAPLDYNFNHVQVSVVANSDGKIIVTYLAEDFKLKCIIVDVSDTTYSFPEKGAVPEQRITNREFFLTGSDETIQENGPFTFTIDGKEISEIEIGNPISGELPVSINKGGFFVQGK